MSKYTTGELAKLCGVKPTLKEAFWANHTPTARRLTCTACGHKSFCVEVAAETEVLEHA